MIPNGGVVSDFEEMMRTSVEFDPTASDLPLYATLQLDYIHTATIASINDLRRPVRRRPCSDRRFGRILSDGARRLCTEPRSLAPLALGLASLLLCRYGALR
jgi:hypothetical protein